jgi:hypothetical protein
MVKGCVDKSNVRRRDYANIMSINDLSNSVELLGGVEMHIAMGLCEISTKEISYGDSYLVDVYLPDLLGHLNELYKTEVVTHNLGQKVDNCALIALNQSLLKLELELGYVSSTEIGENGCGRDR